MKNKLLTLILVSLMLLPLVNASLPGANIDITLISQEPDPANPGEIIDLRFKFENKGSSPAEDIKVSLIEEYPFSLYSGNKEQNIGTLQGLQSAEEGIIVLFKIKVNENAVEGTHYIDLSYTVGDNNNLITIKDFPIRIRTKDLVLSVDSIKSYPELISPGEEFKLSLKLKNNADSVIRDINVKLDLSSETTPFAPYETTAEKQIYQINANTTRILDFNLISMPDSEGGIYKVPIELSYSDISGNSYSKEDVISIKVSASPEILATVESSEIKGDIKTGNIVLKLVNKGLTNLKLVSAKLQESKDFTINSEPEVYLGNIDSDDYETVEYSLTVNSFEQNVPLSLQMSYRDAANSLHKETFEITLKTNATSQIVLIIKNIFSLILIAVVIASLVLGVRWIIKKRKTKRQG